MKLHVIILFVVVILAAACSRTVYIPVETLRRDSIVVANHVVDSVIMADTVIVTVGADTVFRTETRRRDRIRLVRDTIRISSADTVRIMIPAETPSRRKDGTPGLGAIVCATVLVAAVYLLKKRKIFGGCW